MLSSLGISTYQYSWGHWSFWPRIGDTLNQRVEQATEKSKHSKGEAKTAQTRKTHSQKSGICCKLQGQKGKWGKRPWWGKWKTEIQVNGVYKLYKMTQNTYLGTESLNSTWKFWGLVGT